MESWGGAAIMHLELGLATVSYPLYPRRAALRLGMSPKPLSGRYAHQHASPFSEEYS